MFAINLRRRRRRRRPLLAASTFSSPSSADGSSSAHEIQVDFPYNLLFQFHRRSRLDFKANKLIEQIVREAHMDFNPILFGPHHEREWICGLASASTLSYQNPVFLKNDGKILSFIENFRSYQAFFMVIIA